MLDAQAAGARERRAAFQARGWIVLRGVVAERDLAEMSRIFDALIGVPEAGGVVQRLHASHADASILRHLHAGVAAIAGELLGARSVQLLQDALLLKPPERAGSIALHQDYRYTGFLDRPAGLAVGLALTDATADGGCLYVVDGSHAWGLIGGLDVLASGLRPDLEAGLTPAQRRHAVEARIPLEVRAGDVTIHHCLTLHGSGANTSGLPRKSVIAHLIDGACRVVDDRLPPGAQAWFPTDGAGHLAATAFPTLYRGDTDAMPAAQGAGVP